MGPYWFSLILGAAGLAAMALLGFGHHGAGHGHHVGHHAGHGSLGHHGGHTAAHHVAAQGTHGHGQDMAGRLTTLVSPRVIFSFLVGAGAAGLLVRPFTFEPLTALAAVAGGVAFERLVISRIWGFLFRFESRPAATLESALMEEASAAADFDARGQGLIQLELDGQVLQLLGTLRAEERAAGQRVRRGDRLRIEEVDTERNRCTVSYAGSRPPGELT